MNFPNRFGLGLRSSERESKSSAVRGKTNRGCRTRNRYQFSGVCAVRTSQKNVRTLGKRNLPTVARPHNRVSDNIRKIARAACRQRQYPGLCFVLQTDVISHQELGMIRRNIKHSSVDKWSGNDRGVTPGDGSLNQELIRTGAYQLLRTGTLSDIHTGTVGQEAAGLRNAVMGNLGSVEYSR
jgi:hypothetical protein